MYVRVYVRSVRPGPVLDDTVINWTFHCLIDQCWSQNTQHPSFARSMVSKVEKVATSLRVVYPDKAAALEAVSVMPGLAPGAAAIMICRKCIQRLHFRHIIICTTLRYR